MNTNGNCGLGTLKWLMTILSFAIALPGYFDSSSKITFILTVCVFNFGKLIENIEGITQHRTILHTFFCIIGSVLGGVAIGFCFYYFAAISNVTQIVEVPGMRIKEETEAVWEDVEEQLQTEDNLIKLYSDTDMSKYPLFKGEIFYGILFFVLIYFIIQDTVFCGCEYCKYISAKRKVLLSVKKANKLLDVSAE